MPVQKSRLFSFEVFQFSFWVSSSFSSLLSVLGSGYRLGKEALQKARAFFLVTLRACLQKGFANLRDASSFARSNRLQFFLQVRPNAQRKPRVLYHRDKF